MNKTIIVYVLLFCFYTKSFAQLILRKTECNCSCEKLTFENVSKDSVYILKQGLILKLDSGGCTTNMTDVDSINKRILIHTSYTPDDFFEIEMPIWLYIFPGKTQSFLIAKNKNSNYSVTVEAGVRAMKINKKIHRIRSKRKVYKIKMRYMLFEY